MNLLISEPKYKVIIAFLLFTIPVIAGAQTKLKFQRVARMSKENIFFGEGNSTDKIFLLGGQTSLRLYSSDLQVYDNTIGKWLRLPLKQLQPISFSSSIFINEWNSLLFGGGLREEGAQVLLIDALTIIDAENFRLKTVGYLPESAKNLEIARDENYVYFFGGSTAIEPDGYASYKVTFSDKFYQFEISTGIVKELPNLPVPMETTGGIIDGYLYTFGGYDGSAISDIYQFDIANNTWRKFGQLQKSLSSSTAEIVDHYFILVGDYFDTDLLLIYDTQSQQEYTFKMNIKGRHKGAAIINKELHVFGGTQSGLLSNQHYKIPLERIFEAITPLEEN